MTVSTRPNAGDESIYLGPQAFGLARQLVGGGEHLCRCNPGLLGSPAYIHDIDGHLLRALSGLLDIPPDLVRSGTLFLDRRGNRAGNLIHLSNGPAYAEDSADSSAGLCLDFRNL